MTQNLGEFFLPGMRLVSTTPDTGFYMSEARDWVTRLADRPSLFALEVGNKFPGLLLALLSITFGLGLEDASRYFLYLGVTLTSFSVYLFFHALRQQVLGLLTGSALILFWPVYSRTSMGMFDTDILNLAFFISILWLLYLSAMSRRVATTVAFALFAGLLFQLFTMWYPYRGFVVPFFFSYLAVALSSRSRVWHKLVGASAFLMSVGSLSIWGNLASFLNTYLFREPGHSSVSLVESPSVGELRSRVYSTITEVAPVSFEMLRNDFGGIAAFCFGFLGILLWWSQDWRRLLISLPMLAFGFLYLVSGPRFAFYYAPIFLAGTILLSSNLIYSVYGFIKLRIIGQVASNPRDGEASVNHLRVESVGVSYIVVGVISLACLFWPIGVLPNKIFAPGPVIRASEILSLDRAVRSAGNPRVFVATLWDYGYEIAYQTGVKPLTDGGSPGSLKTIYFYRALLSSDPDYSADEIRFSAYFSNEMLAEPWPRRPSTSRASDIDHDILLFLPSDLQTKMFTVYRVAGDLLPKEMRQDYDPKRSLFFRLYHESPPNLGPFQLVGTDSSGARIYRLPAPRR